MNAHAGDASNTALYSTFAVVGFFAGTITNKLGVRLAMSLSGVGYTMYVAAYLCYNHTNNFGFIVFSGFFLGCCAGVLWAAQGVIMMSYPPEGLKGRYIGYFWMIFNLGGVIGALVSDHIVPGTSATLTLASGTPWGKYQHDYRRNSLRRYVYRLHRPHFLRCRAGLDSLPRRRRYSPRWLTRDSHEESDMGE